MFILGEIGQAIGPHNSSQEAVDGVISETGYWPRTAFVTNWLIGAK